MNAFDQIVIGAGPAGLAAATRAVEAGQRVCLLEKNPQPGGSVQTVAADGYLAESGPNTLALGDHALDPLFAAAGLAERLIPANPAAKSRFIVRAGKPHALPASPLGLIRTPILTTRAKLRLFGDLFKSRTPGTGTITLGAYIRHRLGPEAVDYGLNPLIGGIYAGDPDQLSLRYAFPGLHPIATSSRSLILGAIRAARKKRRETRHNPTTANRREGRRMLSFPDGLQTLTGALATRVRSGTGSELRTAVGIQRIRHTPSGSWEVHLNDGYAVEGHRLVLAVPAHALSQLPINLDAFAGVAARATEIRYPAVTSVSLGYPREAIAHPLGGFGALVPARERLSILGVLFASELFPNRAPRNHALLTCFTGGLRQPGIAGLGDDELVQVVHRDLVQLLDLSADPVWQSITRWPRAIPQYDEAYGRALAAFEAFEAACPTVKIIGQVRDGISLPNSLLSGWKNGIEESA